MRILINFSSLKSGGGQNVAMNFLGELFNMTFHDLQFFFFVAKDSEPHKYLQRIGYKNYYVVSRKPLKRILFEIFLSKKILMQNKICIIYSYFGFGFFTKKIPQVSGSADSNLYFPEINFWKGYNGFGRFKKKVIDLYRIYGIKRVKAVIFENEILEKKSHELYNLKKTTFIKPSINLNFKSLVFRLPFIVKIDVPIGLFLCNWQLNKNIMIIPELARILKELGCEFHFLITAPEDGSQEHLQFVKLMKINDVENMVSIVGQVVKEELASLYNQISYVFLLSKLESFSNNIIEAWHFQRSLIISDEPWSRSICKNAAFYVERDSASHIVNRLIDIMDDKTKELGVVQKGSFMLKEYPSSKERIQEEMRYLKYVFKNV